MCGNRLDNQIGTNLLYLAIIALFNFFLLSLLLKGGAAAGDDDEDDDDDKGEKPQPPPTPQEGVLVHHANGEAGAPYEMVVSLYIHRPLSSRKCTGCLISTE